MKRYFLYGYLLLVVLISGFLGYYLSIRVDGPAVTVDDTEATLPQMDAQTRLILKKMQSVPIPKAKQRETSATVIIPRTQQPKQTDQPDWQRYASVLQPRTKKPKLIIIIDDLGLKTEATKRLARIEGPYTLAFLPYADDLPFQTQVVHDAGHELMVHMPMQPSSDSADPGPNAMLVGLSQEEFDRRLLWNLSQFKGFVGVNNHMGSKLTAAAPQMARILTVLKDRGLVFVDSLTTNASFGQALSNELNLPFVARDIFLDNNRTKVEIEAQLQKAIRIAEIRGYAIAIGHPYDETLDLLEDLARRKDDLPFELAPLSSILKR